METILRNISEIQSKKAILDKLPVMLELKFEIYSTQNNEGYNALRNYEIEMVTLLNTCFKDHRTDSLRLQPEESDKWFIAKFKNEIVAVLVVIFKDCESIEKSRDNSAIASIWSVCRKEKYRDFQFGRHLLEYAIEYIRKNHKNYKKICLVASQNPVSRTKFYESLNFKKARTYYYNGEPIMEINVS